MERLTRLPFLLCLALLAHCVLAFSIGRWRFFSPSVEVTRKLRADDSDTDDSDNDHSPPPPRWGIFSQVHQAVDYDWWIRYHLALSPTVLYVLVENDPDARVLYENGTADSDGNVDDRVIVVRKETEGNANPSSWGSDLCSRKSVNFNKAADRLRQSPYNLEWMIILDADELLFSPKGLGVGEVLRTDASTLDCVIVHNEEAVFREINPPDVCFSSDTKFVDCLTNRAGCLAYVNGKSFGRISNPDIKQAGSHRMKSNGGSRCTNRNHLPKDNLVILHFESCNFDKWKTKFQKMMDELDETTNYHDFHGTKGDYLKLQFPFYYESIEHLLQCNDDESSRVEENPTREETDTNESLRQWYSDKKIKPWANALSKTYDFTSLVKRIVNSLIQQFIELQILI